MTWVRDEDLVETVYDLRVVNSATQTKASSTQGADITELGPEGVTLKVPRGLCSTGHLLSIEVTLRQVATREQRVPSRNPRATLPPASGQIVSKLVGTGKVLTTAPFDGTSMVISVKFYQFDEAAWQDFRAKHAARQVRVSTAIQRRQD